MKSKFSQAELLELESHPKTPFQIWLDRLICIFPLICIGLAAAEYRFLPDAKSNSKAEYYLPFLGFMAALYFFLLLAGLLKKEYIEKARYNAPLYGVIALVLVAYDMLTLKYAVLPMPFFPWVNRIFNAMADDKDFLLDSTVSTVKLLLNGYLIGVIVGLVTGIACGYSKKINYWLSPIMKFLGPIPTTTWIPVVMVLASTLYRGSVFIIALGVWYSVSLATLTGISNVTRDYFDAANTLGAKEYQLIFRIAIPAAVPNMFQGMTQGMSIACTAIMVAEMMGTESGLGWYITWQKSWAKYDGMYGAIIVICIIFTLITFLLQKIRGKCTRWQEGMVR